MPDFDDVVNGIAWDAKQVQQVIDAWKGNSGKGVRFRLISVDEANYAANIKQLDASSGLIALFERHDGNDILKLTKDGLRFSPDGTVVDLTPASLTGTETLTNKTLRAVKWVWGTAIPSAASIAIPSDGNAFSVTGTTGITAITGGISGLEVTLKFASAGVLITPAATLQIAGPYWSLVNSTLTLIYDGTNWVETGRSGAGLIGAHAVRATDQNIPTGATYTPVSWSSSPWNYGGMWAGGAPTLFTVLAGGAGKYRFEGTVLWDNSTQFLEVAARVGADAYPLWGNDSQSAPNNNGFSWSTVLDLAAAATVELVVKHDSGGGVLVKGSATGLVTRATLTRICA